MPLTGNRKRDTFDKTTFDLGYMKLTLWDLNKTYTNIMCKQCMFSNAEWRIVPSQPTYIETMNVSPEWGNARACSTLLESVIYFVFMQSEDI